LGITPESIAIQKYIVSKSKVTVEKCGFIIHPRQGWFGASPDGHVVGKLFKEAEDILEKNTHSQSGMLYH